MSPALPFCQLLLYMVKVRLRAVVTIMACYALIRVMLPCCGLCLMLSTKLTAGLPLVFSRATFSRATFQSWSIVQGYFCHTGHVARTQSAQVYSCSFSCFSRMSGRCRISAGLGGRLAAAAGCCRFWQVAAARPDVGLQLMETSCIALTGPLASRCSSALLGSCRLQHSLPQGR